MPTSKRNKLVSLTKKKKNALELKKRIVQEVHSCVDKYSNIFVFSVNNMRNNKLKAVRDQWKDSRFFFGKNKVMALALGRCMEEDYKPNLHKISKRLKGQCGLLFTNRNKADILEWFDSFSEADYARSGNTAAYSVNLPEGPLPQFPHSLEPYLRQLGLPTTLQKGIIHLVKEHQVCNEGDLLTPENARILKLLGHEMVEFKVNLDCMWSSDGSFLKLSSDEVSEAGGGKMAVDDDDSDEEDDVHDEETASQGDPIVPNDPAAKISDEEDDNEAEEGVSPTDSMSLESSGNKHKAKHSRRNKDKKNDSVVKEIAYEIVDESFIKKSKTKKSGDVLELVDDQDTEMQIDSLDENLVSEKSESKKDLASPSQNDSLPANDDSDKLIASAKVSNIVIDKSQLPPEIDELIAEVKEKTKISPKHVTSDSNHPEGDDAEVEKRNKKGLKRKSKVTSKKSSVSANVEEENDEIEDEVKRKKTPVSKVKDMAKKMGADLSSPEEKSPLFRTLRNRTVKVERKKK